MHAVLHSVGPGGICEEGIELQEHATVRRVCHGQQGVSRGVSISAGRHVSGDVNHTSARAGYTEFFFQRILNFFFFDFLPLIFAAGRRLFVGRTWQNAVFSPLSESNRPALSTGYFVCTASHSRLTEAQMAGLQGAAES